MKNFQPQILQLQQPYPLIAIEGFIFPQMGTLIIQNEEGFVQSWPIIKNEEPDNIDGQIPFDLIDGNPIQKCCKLGFNEGDTISWKQFIEGLERIYRSASEKDNVDLTEIMEDLELNGVEIENLPKHINIFLAYGGVDDAKKPSGENKEIIYAASYDMVFDESHIDVNDNMYAHFLSQIFTFHLLAPDAKFHVLFNHDDADGLKILTKVQEDIEKELAKPEIYHEFDPNCDDHLLWQAKTMQEERLALMADALMKTDITFLSDKNNVKDAILNILCKKLEVNPKKKETLWRLVCDNNLLNLDRA